MLLGIDDTDSPDGMCTTYLGAKLVEYFKRAGYTIGELRLVRLNPNVIWKTRGNAAISIEILDGNEDEVFQIACDMIEDLAEFSCENTNPGVVLVTEKPNPDFYYKALRDFCTVSEAEKILNEIGAKYHGYKSGRGLIGALAAVSSEFLDATYECLSYRCSKNFGTKRVYDPESFFLSEQKTHPHTWDTVDVTAKKVVCVPHGNDPVLYGIRGDSQEWVLRAVTFLKTEEISLSEIWKTNQGTDAHLLPYIGNISEGVSYIMDGVVLTKPKTITGGHVNFFFKPDVGELELLTFAYEPTKELRSIVRELIPGDHITICASYLHEALNLEKFRVNDLAKKELRISPKCPLCGGRMTSAGKDKGYKCRECSGRVRDVFEKERLIQKGWYEVPPDARRHLAKPILRITSLERITCFPNQELDTHDT